MFFAKVLISILVFLIFISIVTNTKAYKKLEAKFFKPEE